MENAMKPTHTFIRVPVVYDGDNNRICNGCHLLKYDLREMVYRCGSDELSALWEDPWGNARPFIGCPIDKVLNENDD